MFGMSLSGGFGIVTAGDVTCCISNEESKTKRCSYMLISTKGFEGPDNSQETVRLHS
jgi:hypothetical protein